VTYPPRESLPVEPLSPQRIWWALERRLPYVDHGERHPRTLGLYSRRWHRHGSVSREGSVPEAAVDDKFAMSGAGPVPVPGRLPVVDWTGRITAIRDGIKQIAAPSPRPTVPRDCGLSNPPLPRFRAITRSARLEACIKDPVPTQQGNAAAPGS
jgi:hypothetical protein